MELTWVTDRYVEESNDKDAKDGTPVYVADVPAELLRAARQPIGVLGVGYRLPDEPDSTLFAIAETLRIALGFERAEYDLQYGGIAAMHAHFFDRFVRAVHGVTWSLRITVVTQEHPQALGQEHHLIYVSSETMTSRLLQPHDVLGVLLPFVRDELEPQLRRLHII